MDDSSARIWGIIVGIGIALMIGMSSSLKNKIGKAKVFAWVPTGAVLGFGITYLLATLSFTDIKGDLIVLGTALFMYVTSLSKGKRLFNNEPKGKKEST